MSGDNPGLWACHYNHLLRNRNHTLHCSAMLEIDKGIEAVQIGVGDVNHIGVDKMCDRVSARMGIRCMEDTDRLAVQMKGDPIGERHNRQCSLGSRRNLASEGFQELIGIHQLTHVIVCDDNHTGFT